MTAVGTAQVQHTTGWRIGELASQLGLNPKTIRYYESIGLLPQPQRTAAGYRFYGQADRERLKFILQARAIGLRLDEIKEILTVRQEGHLPCEHVLAMLDGKLQTIEEQLQVLTAFRQEVLALRDEAAETKQAEACVCGIIERHQPSYDRRHSQTPLTFQPTGRHSIRGRR